MYTMHGRGRVHVRSTSTPVRRRRQALPAEFLSGKARRVRRKASRRARLSRWAWPRISRWAWPRDIACPARASADDKRKPTLTRGRYYHKIQ